MQSNSVVLLKLFYTANESYRSYQNNLPEELSEEDPPDEESSEEQALLSMERFRLRGVPGVLALLRKAGVFNLLTTAAAEVEGAMTS